ncbi:hypothetical protein ASU35_03645 [Acetivibrio ethanolgignens]|uniref:Immunity protein 30 domain-containing protein n=1 Tax=Acetivibrio ethanolgignens TaxID=290052 RepID=A0A0V8QBG0_9FIRM|nr:hypothetical protein ASU35_03645 [Acetivibrio ethanolgignens]
MSKIKKSTVFPDLWSDSWYDDGFHIAQSIMNDFSKDDWEKLSNDILNKDLEWKKKLVYCLDNQIIQEELEIIGKLLHTKDDELLEMCIDTLRSFDNEMGHLYIKMHPEIIKEAKERMDTAGNATKRMLQCFLEVFDIL